MTDYIIIKFMTLQKIIINYYFITLIKYIFYFEFKKKLTFQIFLIN